ncbi:Putative growth factor receptor cysteine-rich domain superfamily [Colletotrichum destructivum]|uniref:Growth factor receptor cysteine-rich domain superfamily n=1 Tax=Colletotrichum destructivum TaxID=34406 RepID=A0AAX4I544_9PEZI|nr:Putative growth factor receptor cysteine-rich domain superfamily [Colletotrichum destructivum]
MKFAALVSALTLLASAASAATCYDCNYRSVDPNRCSSCASSQVPYGNNQRCVACTSPCLETSDYAGARIYDC